MKPFLHLLRAHAGRSKRRSRRRHRKLVGECAVTVDVRRKNLAIALVLGIGCTQDKGPRAIPKEYRHVTAPGGNIQPFGMSFRAYQQDLLAPSAPDELVCNRKPEKKSRTLLAH